MIDSKILQKELESLPEGGIALIETSAEKALEAGLEATKIMTGRGETGIILSASRPYENLAALYLQNGIPIKKTLILDCLTTSAKGKDIPENVVFLETTSDLTSMSLEIQKAFEKTSGKRFIFVDSITTFLMYNDATSLARFIHFVLTKARLNSISGILISLAEGTPQEVRAEIAQLCDKVIKI
ncbi:MAG: hypothetical protein WC792_00820 [Candidatus Micrarchaeia archaeon]|jgi:KaiC/GvpD/RAD55 family RecA-like ATPase